MTCSLDLLNKSSENTRVFSKSFELHQRHKLAQIQTNKVLNIMHESSYSSYSCFKIAKFTASVYVICHI